MIKIRIIRNNSGKIKSFSAEGHADFSSLGKDIVCAAVSALLQSTILGLTHYLRRDEVYFFTKHGYLTCHLKEDINGKKDIAAQAILETLNLSLHAIKENYPKYISFEQKVG